MLIYIYLLVNILVRVESQGAPDDEAKKTVLEEYIRQYRKLFKMSKKIQFVDNSLTTSWIQPARRIHSPDIFNPCTF